MKYFVKILGNYTASLLKNTLPIHFSWEFDFHNWFLLEPAGTTTSAANKQEKQLQRIFQFAGITRN